jgi:hypothetical protein
LADLDASGNTTKAVTKSIAIASAVLAAVSLFASFTTIVKVDLNIAADPYVFVGLLIGGRCHVSSAVAIREIVPYIKVIFSASPEKAAEMSEELELGEAMVRYLSPENADQILRLM